MQRLIGILLGMLFWLPVSLSAQQPDKTESPYLLVQVPDSNLVESVPLKHTEAEVQIVGFVADVTLRQVYQNEGDVPLEAVYVFPASTRSAVYAMQMRIGKREIEAVIKEKQAARATYEKAKAKGQTASLLEQHRPNVFQMNVANILPGDSIVVELSYTELLTPTAGEYEFVLPTVVGPRYSAPKTASRAQADAWARTPYTQEKVLPAYTFGFSARIASGLPVREVSSPSHQFDLTSESDGSASLALQETEMDGANRDVVIRYRLQGERLQSGMLTYREKGEKFFLWTAQPPKRPEPADVPNREYIFIVDVSGSMHGFPLETSKKLLRELIGSMSPTERFNVILFASTSSILQEGASLPATEANIRKAINFIDSPSGSGGTSLLPALQRGLDLELTEGFSRSFVICTDGLVTVEREAYGMIRENLGKANLFAFGIGKSVNRHLIEGLAGAGSGEPFVVLNGTEAPETAKKFRKYIEAPVLTDISVDFGDMEVYDVEPIHIPDVFAQRPIMIFGKYKGSLSGTATLQGISGREVFVDSLQLNRVKPDKRNQALRYLWARERIRNLSDFQGPTSADSVSQQILQLGLQYNLLTPYTSFVAVDKRKRNKTGGDTTMNQVLPLPQDLSNRALGNPLSSTSLPGRTTGGTYSFSFSANSQSEMQLSEVVVTGYGVQSQDYFSCVLTRVEESTSTFTRSIGAELKGKIAGVQITSSSGAPGATANILIRGVGSVAGNTQPLVVIDGIPMTQNHLLNGPANQVGAYNGGNDPLSHLDPGDIQQISVLKGSGATALYGSRAANGVILITTKSPPIGKSEWEWTSKAGLSLPFPRSSDAPADLQPAWNQYHRLQYSKGTQKGKLFSAISWLDQGGIVPETGLSRLSGRVNMERHWHTKFRSGLKLSGSTVQLQQGMNDVFGLNATSEPFQASWNSAIKQLQGQANGFIQWKILPELHFESRVGLEYNRSDQQYFHQAQFTFPFPYSGRKEWVETQLQSFTQTHKLTYKRSFHAQTLEAGITGIQQRWNWAYATELGLGVHAEAPLSTAQQMDERTANAQQTQLSLNPYVNYQIGIRYLLSAHLGIANQSQQGTQLPWQVFPGLGATWNVHNEGFFPTQDWIKQLKVRASWSLNGNNRLPLLQGWTNPQAQNPLQDPYHAAFLSRRQIPDQLDWELQRHGNIGVDLRLFKNRLSLTADWYRKTTQNFLAEVPNFGPETTYLELQNVGTLRNQGWELTLKGEVFSNGKLQLTPSLNFAVNRNQVLSLLDHNSIQTGVFDPISTQFIPIGQIEAGQPLGNFYGYRTDDQGNLSAEPTVIGNALPDFIYGVGLETKWKIYALKVQGVGVHGADILNFQRIGRTSLPVQGISDGLIEEGSYFRIQDLQLRATLPAHRWNGALKKLSKLTLSLSVQNLMLWTPYSGFDPEVNIFGPNRQMLYGVDYGAYPRAQTWQLGVQMGF